MHSTTAYFFYYHPSTQAKAGRHGSWSEHLVNDETPLHCLLLTSRVGQNHIYTVYIRYFWQENHQIYGHIRRIYTVLANPTHFLKLPSSQAKADKHGSRSESTPGNLLADRNALHHCVLPLLPPILSGQSMQAW